MPGPQESVYARTRPGTVPKMGICRRRGRVAANEEWREVATNGGERRMGVSVRGKM